MGGAMAANLARAGFPLTVWNRTPGKSGPVLELGAIEAKTPAEAAASSDIVLVCVSDTPDVEAVLLGDNGVQASARDGLLVIDASTISPGATRAFADNLRERGVGLVDAPVSGGSEGAQKGTLSVFVGGEAADVERARPVLEAIGKMITHVGPVGSGQAVKAVNQVILAGAYLGVAEGIVLALKAGLDVEQVVEALSGGAAQSWVLTNRSGRMIDNKYPLGFKVARSAPSVSRSRLASLVAATPMTTCRRSPARSGSCQVSTINRDRRGASVRRACRCSGDGSAARCT
jgi:3-hydroxyisobutyrate dehydrogenase